MKSKTVMNGKGEQLLLSYIAAKNEKVWIIGGSEISAVNAESWTYQLTSEGFFGFLLFSCESAEAALSDVCEALESSKPLYAVWSFTESCEAFVSLCEKCGVEPVLTTDYRNTEHNKAVKATGKKYIDFAAYGIKNNAIFTEAAAKSMAARALVDFPEMITPTVPIRKAYAKEMNAKADYITTGFTRVRDGKHLVFSARLGEMNDDSMLIVGNGYYRDYGRWIEIKKDTVQFFGYASWMETPLTSQFTLPHGLKLKNYITVIIGSDADNLGNTLTVVTDGGFFTKRRFAWDSCNGEAFAKSVGVILKDARLNWTCVDYTKDIWLIGASFFSLYNPARWPYYLYSERYDKNVFIAGKGGMDGPEGIQELKDALKSGCVPKYVAWGVGMNDGSDDGDVKPAYYESLLELMQICKDNGISLYVMDMPNTPLFNNSYKLDYVVNRRGKFADYDYKVIDIARAIDGKRPMSDWYEHMISSDNVHPSNLGARGFYLQFLCDFPELMCGAKANRYEKAVAELDSGEKIYVPADEKAKDEQVFTFSADFEDELSAEIKIGGEIDGVGTSYVKVDNDYVSVYTVNEGKEILISRVDNPILMKDIINLRIHVRNNIASIAMMSAGEKKYVPGKTNIFKFESYWNTAGVPFATVNGASLKNVSFKWLTV